MSARLPICVKCQKPVTHPDYVELFEWMHWLCFNLEYEHEADPDEPRHDPSCPWQHIKVMRRELERLGADPEELMELAAKDRWDGVTAS